MSYIFMHIASNTYRVSLYCLHDTELATFLNSFTQSYFVLFYLANNKITRSWR